MTFTEIAKANQMTTATVNRYLHTLSGLDYVVQNPNAKTYSLTPKIIKLGISLFRNLDLRNLLLPHMLSINKEFDITVTCGINNVDGMLVLERIQASDFKTQKANPGIKLPLNCSALGKAMIAFEDPENLKLLLKKGSLEKRTPESIVDMEGLTREMEKIRERGYALSRQELLPNLLTMAVPIFKDGKVEGALGGSLYLLKEYPEGYQKKVLHRLMELSELVSL